MVRRSGGGGRHKGIHQGVQKHTIRFKTTAHKDTVRHEKFSQLGEKSFRFVYWLCCSLYLVPTSVVKGKLQKHPRRKLLCHYIVLCILLIGIFHKVFRSLQYILSHSFGDLTSIICTTVLAGYSFVVLIACVNIIKTDETIELVNSWPNVLACVGEATFKRYNTFQDLWLCVKVIPVAAAPFFIGAASSFIATILCPSIPCAIMAELERSVDVNRLWIKLTCASLEFAIMCLPLLCMVLAVQVLEIGINVLRMQLEAIKSLPMETYADWKVIQRLYNYGAIYNGILNPWYSFVVSPALFTASAVMTLCLYVSIRHTELPFYVHIVFPYIFFMIAGACLSMSWDGVAALRASEGLVLALRSTSTPHLAHLDPLTRLRTLKRAKANKPNFFKIGSLTQFSVDVPAAMAEEILNQLLFLLTL